jgi:hypothetical protein
MQPATIRRLLVFGVCLVGVGCLYLVPSMAGSSRHSGTSREQDLSTTASNTTVGLSTAADVSAPDLAGVPTRIASSTVPDTTAPSADRSSTPAGAAGDDARSRSTARAGATAAAPGRDEEPPAAVGRLTVLSSDPDRVTVSWPATDDDSGVVGYRVLLNGFFVLATQQTRATLAWFNDSNTHVIQVRAVDAAGNEGPSSPTLLVSRPAPDPEPTSPGASASAPTTKPTVAASPAPTESSEQTTDTKNAAPGTTPQSGTEEDGS